MAVTIPLSNDVPDYALQVELDGQTYGLELHWNFRSEQWAISLFTSEGDAIALNIGVVVDFPLGRRIQRTEMPPGVLMAVDTAGGHAAPAFGDLGTRVQLLYFPLSELS